MRTLGKPCERKQQIDRWVSYLVQPSSISIAKIGNHYIYLLRRYNKLHSLTAKNATRMLDERLQNVGWRARFVEAFNTAFETSSA